MAGREPPAKPGFRRRIPLELKPSELEALEEAEARYGTKRATLVAGLEALNQLAKLDKQLGQQTSACEQALARAGELEKKTERLAKELEKAKAELTSAKRGKQTAERKGSSAGAEAEDLATALASERAALDQLEEEIAELEAASFEALHCPRCNRWAGPSDWASRKDGEREYVYHRPCGYHPGGILDTTSLLGFRAAD